MSIFEGYDWPGNIRELENMIKRIILFGEEEVIRGPIGNHINGGIDAFSSDTLLQNGSKEMETLNLKRVGKEAAELAEKEVIQKTLQETHWNRKKAARLLGVSYKALLYKIQKYRMDELKKFRRMKEEMG
jgi:DNA-binding NtrC family response regulator